MLYLKLGMFAHARGKPLATIAKSKSLVLELEQRARNVKGCAVLAYAAVETQSKDSLNDFGRFCLKGFMVFLYISVRVQRNK